MATSITIENSNRRPDKLYIGCLSVFWIVWTPVTAYVTYLAITDFDFFFIVWLPFGYLGVILIPRMMIQFRRPQVLEATEGELIVRGTGSPFGNVVSIPRDQPLKLHLGHYDNGEAESVVTLNLLFGSPGRIKRVMISPLSHPQEKRQIFHDVESFLRDNNFRLEIQDDHPKPRSEKADAGNEIKNGGRGGI